MHIKPARSQYWPSYITELHSTFYTCGPTSRFHDLIWALLSHSCPDIWVKETDWLNFPCSGLMSGLRFCGPLQWTLLRGWEFLPQPQPPHVFTTRGFEAVFPHAGTLGYVVSIAPQLFLSAYLQANVINPINQPLPHPPVHCLALHPFLPQLPISTLTTSLDDCFFFNSFIVGLPCSLIFWQFWLFFVFKLVILLLVVWGSEAFLPTPPSWLEVSSVNFHPSHEYVTNSLLKFLILN